MSAHLPHPHFDDRGTLSWHVSWNDALAAARAQKKLVFVELGRELCSQCRTLVQNVVPSPAVAPLLKEHFVALAADADDSEDAVIALAGQLDDAYMLPFVMLADADGRFLAGSSGAVDPKRFVELLKSVVE